MVVGLEFFEAPKETLILRARLRQGQQGKGEIGEVNTIKMGFNGLLP